MANIECISVLSHWYNRPILSVMH